MFARQLTDRSQPSARCNEVVAQLNLDKSPPTADCISIDSDYGSSLASSMSAGFKRYRSSLADRIAALITSLNVTDSEQLEQLDRENAHFSLSESIIETFEAMKCEAKRGALPTVTPPVPTQRNPTPDGAERLRDLPATSNHEKSKQMIRFRRKARSAIGGLGSDASSNLTSSPSTSLSSLDHLTDHVDSEDDYSRTAIEAEEASDLFVDEVTEELDLLDTSGCLNSIRENGLSLSNTSLFSRKYSARTLRHRW